MAIENNEKKTPVISVTSLLQKLKKGPEPVQKPNEEQQGSNKEEAQVQEATQEENAAAEEVSEQQIEAFQGMDSAPSVDVPDIQEENIQTQESAPVRENIIELLADQTISEPVTAESATEANVATENIEPEEIHNEGNDSSIVVEETKVSLDKPTEEVKSPKDVYSPPSESNPFYKNLTERINRSRVGGEGGEYKAPFNADNWSIDRIEYSKSEPLGYISFLEEQSFIKFPWEKCDEYSFVNKLYDFITNIDFSIPENKLFKNDLKNIILCSLLRQNPYKTTMDDYTNKIKKMKIMADIEMITLTDYYVLKKELNMVFDF